MYTITIWVIWAVYMVIGLVTGLIATAPMRWQERLAFASASVAAFIVALVWSIHFGL